MAAFCQGIISSSLYHL